MRISSIKNNPTKTNSTYLLCYSIFIGIIILTLSSCSTNRAILKEQSQYEWKLIKESPNDNPDTWATYSRKVQDSKFKEFKIEGIINTSPSQAVAALRKKTEDGRACLMDETGYVKVLSSNKTEALIYSVYYMPFPFKDRAICERLKFSKDEITGVHTIIWTEDWKEAPLPEKGVINMSYNQGSWKFIPIGKDKSMVVHTSFTEPGGNLPAWIINSTGSEELPKKLSNIEQIVNQMNHEKSN